MSSETPLTADLPPYIASRLSMPKIRSSRSRGGNGWRLVSTRTVGSIVIDMSGSFVIERR